MIPGFGKQSLTLGSAPQCDVVLAGPGVAPEHARLVHQGGGKLSFVNLGSGASNASGRPLGSGEQVPFDFRTQFFLGQVELPFDHPAISLCLMAVGQQSAPAGTLVLGRDPSRTSIALQHPSVSSQHATVALDRMMVTDHNSTSGTYVGGVRAAAGTPTPIPPDGLVFFGPVPVRVPLLMQLAQAAAAGAHAMPAGAPGMAPPMGAAPGPQHGGGMPMAPHAAAPMPMAQPQASPAAAAAPMRKHKTVFGQLDFSGKDGGIKTIGRTPNNDIVVPHPQVSAQHAHVEQTGGQLYLIDRGSANGTYVRGQRVPAGQRIPIQSGEKIYVGPMPLQLAISASGAVELVQEAYAEERWAGRPLYEIEAWSLFLEVPDRDDRTKSKVLLDNISFKALPGDMIALMGPSGAGKTTLLLALNGYQAPTTGLVRINGEDLYSIYDTLRGSIGYVPQDDLVHPELTVTEAVRYSAKFRLPPDTTNAEIDARVAQTLRDLGLEMVAHLQIGAPEKKILSGGQRKRVNIALELVTDPVILYLDEPTSGLASDDAAGLIHLLHDLTKATGKTIIMTIHQPAKDEFEKFSHCLVLGYGGVPVFFGPTKPDAYNFFGSWQHQAIAQGLRKGPPVEIDNPRDMFAQITEREKPIFEQLKAANPNVQRGEVRHQVALLWRDEFHRNDNPTYQKMFSGRRAVGTGEGQRGIPDRRPVIKGQFGLLLSRYFKTKVRDVTGTIIMLAQAPIIGGLLAVIFGAQTEATPAWCLGALQELVNRSNQKTTGDLSQLHLAPTRDNTGAIFFLVVAAVWFGTSNAAREVVRERSIYLRERMVNLGLFNYVLSKFILLAMFCMVQCAMLLGIVFVALGFRGGMVAFAQEYAALVSTSLSAVALGLLLSTLVSSSEAAMALTPIALIPQVVLGGLMVPTTTIPKLAFLMYAVPARWGFEAAVVAERLANREDPAWLIALDTDKSSGPDFVMSGKFECAVAQLAGDNFVGAWGFTTYENVWMPHAVLLGGTVVTVLLLCFLLKRRDPV
jgi:ABC-type multidrug transport system ATPase subunit